MEAPYTTNIKADYEPPKRDPALTNLSPTQSKSSSLFGSVKGTPSATKYTINNFEKSIKNYEQVSPLSQKKPTVNPEEQTSFVKEKTADFATQQTSYQKPLNIDLKEQTQLFSYTTAANNLSVVTEDKNVEPAPMIDTTPPAAMAKEPSLFTKYADVISKSAERQVTPPS